MVSFDQVFLSDNPDVNPNLSTKQVIPPETEGHHNYQKDFPSDAPAPNNSVEAGKRSRQASLHTIRDPPHLLAPALTPDGHAVSRSSSQASVRSETPEINFSRPGSTVPANAEIRSILHKPSLYAVSPGTKSTHHASVSTNAPQRPEKAVSFDATPDPPLLMVPEHEMPDITRTDSQASTLQDYDDRLTTRTNSDVKTLPPTRSQMSSLYPVSPRTKPQPRNDQRRSTAGTRFDDRAKLDRNFSDASELPQRSYATLMKQFIDHPSRFIREEIDSEGESLRRGVHFKHFFRLVWHSSCMVSKYLNFLWPFVPIAIIIYLTHKPDPEHHNYVDDEYWNRWSKISFAMTYIAMIPAANLLGYAGQELSRKLPKVTGKVFETSIGSATECIMCTVILVKYKDKGVPIVRAALLGSILANILLSLGLCFFVGGLHKLGKMHKHGIIQTQEDYDDEQGQQSFSAAISEVGSNMLLVGALALVIPTAYSATLASQFYRNSNGNQEFTEVTYFENNGTFSGVLAHYDDTNDVKLMSRAIAFILLAAYFLQLWFNTQSHQTSYYHAYVSEKGRANSLAQYKRLTLTETVLALCVAFGAVTGLSFMLVDQIEPLVLSSEISDAFLGLILVPLVEKAAEGLSTIDEAYNNKMNHALSHVLGASVQTTLLITPAIVLVGWFMKVDMNLRFDGFDCIVLILAILVITGFLRDGKSDYLEGGLSVLVYFMIAIAAFFYPDTLGHSGSTLSEHTE